ncbi:hypothetical protein [Brochothrix thermosphacta]|nr:hypothetical protein [Brochothrix thermosphacta]
MKELNEKINQELERIVAEIESDKANIADVKAMLESVIEMSNSKEPI